VEAVDPLGKPGKFSTSLVVVSCPPGAALDDQGVQLALAAYTAAVRPAQPVPMMTTLSTLCLDMLCFGFEPQHPTLVEGKWQIEAATVTVWIRAASPRPARSPGNPPYLELLVEVWGDLLKEAARVFIIPRAPGARRSSDSSGRARFGRG